MSYILIEENSRIELIMRVNSEIARGWRPLGAPFYVYEVRAYHQAMTFEPKAST